MANEGIDYKKVVKEQLNKFSARLKEQELQQIKEMYFEENLSVPVNLKERLDNYRVCLDKNMQPIHNESTRELFLIFATNDLLSKKTISVNVLTNLDTELHIKYMKLNKELQELWKV